MRRLRHLVNPSFGNKAVVEITARTANCQFLLKPDPEVDAIIAGVLARAKEKTGTEICAFAFPSNHFHLLIGVDDTKQMADFMTFVMSNIARKLNIHYGRSGPFWDRRYSHIEVSRDDATLAKRFAYIMKQGVKEGLVSSPLDWPGLHCAKQLYARTTTVVGKWEDRSKRYRLEQAGKEVTDEDVISEVSFELDPLPSFCALGLETWFQWVRELIEVIIEEFRGQPVLGADAVLEQQITDRPTEIKRTCAVDFHVRDPAQKREWRRCYRDFVRAFRIACRHLQEAGDQCFFPPGSFPTNPPFVPSPG